MTKTRIREIRACAPTASEADDIIEECLTEIERLQRYTRRGETPPGVPSTGLLIDAPTSPGKKARGTREEINAYAREKGLTPTDAEWFWEKMQEDDWKISKQPVKDWRGRMRQWKLLNVFPSQKQKPAPNGAPPPRKGPVTMTL